MKESILFWMKEHLIQTWAAGSIIFAAIVHILFAIPAPCEFLVHKWDAGDILTYISTVALALLAFWQNRKFKEENDAAQSRLERIGAQANSLSVISKIIEIEYDNLVRLKDAFDDFSTACDPIEISTKLATALVGEDQKLNAMAAMAEQEKRIDDSFFALAREIRIDPQIYNNSSDPFAKVMREYYYAAKAVVKEKRENPQCNSKAKLDELSKLKMDFLGERERLLIRKEKTLDSVLYGNLPLDDIRKMYSREYLTREDLTNGQTQDAQR